MRSSTPLRRARLLFGAAGLALPLTWAGSALAATTAPPAVQTAPAATLFAAINSARTSAGLPPMTNAGDLSAVATEQSLTMATDGYLFHNPSLTTEVANWQALGENVGSGLAASAIASAFMASPEHRANILSTQFTQVGVGAVLYNGLLWVTEDFRLPVVAAPRVASAPTASPSTVSAPAPAPATTSHSSPAPTATKPLMKAKAVSPAASAPAALATPASTAPSPTPVVRTRSALSPADLGAVFGMMTPAVANLAPASHPTKVVSDIVTHHGPSWLTSYRSPGPVLPLAATGLLLAVIVMALGRARRTLIAATAAC